MREENQTIIKALNMFGRVPEQYELLNEIERLNNIIKNLDKMFEYYFIGNKKYDENTVNTIYVKYIKLKELKESGNNEQRNL